MDEIAFEEARLDELRQHLILHEAALAYVRIGRVVRGDTTTDDTRIHWRSESLSPFYQPDGDTLAETPEEMAEALVTWVRRTVRSNWGGEPQVWKLRAYTPKGDSQLFSMRLSAVPTEAPAEVPADAAVPHAAVQEPSTAASR